jgi:hypothetical protein
LLDFLEQGGHLTKGERQKVPVAAFARLVRTRSIREKVGFSADKQGLLQFKNENAAIAGLLHIAHDLASGKVKTGNIYDLDQRNEYAETLPTKPALSKAKLPIGHALGQGTAGSRRRPIPRVPRDRDRMIPSTWNIYIPEPRHARIAKELRELSLAQFPNSVAVLFRVFVELSADYYLIKKMGKTKDEIRVPGYKLTKKLIEIVEDLLAKNVFQRQDAAPIRAACQNNSFLASSVLSMNEYVHNFQMNPTPVSLITAWEAFENFLAVLWK